MAGLETTNEYDCLACGRCCFSRENYVELFAEDLVRLGSARVAQFAVATSLPREKWRTGEDESTRFMRMTEGHCAALEAVPGRWACTVYSDRPTLCEAFTPGSAACLTARARPTQRDD